MAIRIEMTGYCKDCPKAELVLDKINVESFDTTDDTWWDIHCEHEAACERIFKGRFAKEDDQ